MYNKLVSSILIVAIVTCPIRCVQGCGDAGGNAGCCSGISLQAEPQPHPVLPETCCCHSPLEQATQQPGSTSVPQHQQPALPCTHCQCLCSGAIIALKAWLPNDDRISFQPLAHFLAGHYDAPRRCDFHGWFERCPGYATQHGRALRCLYSSFLL